MVGRKDWVWRGMAGHFIGAKDCIFRLCTDIGVYRISTVGAMYTGESKEMSEIGNGRHYETMVFELNDIGEIESYCELDTDGIEKKLNENPYLTDKRAEKMHIKMCEKYAL